MKRKYSLKELFVIIWEFIHKKLNKDIDNVRCAWCCKPATYEIPAFLCDHHWSKWWHEGDETK